MDYFISFDISPIFSFRSLAAFYMNILIEFIIKKRECQRSISRDAVAFVFVLIFPNFSIKHAFVELRCEYTSCVQCIFTIQFVVSRLSIASSLICSHIFRLHQVNGLESNLYVRARINNKKENINNIKLMNLKKNK